MLNIGTGEIIMIAVVALLVLGPKRLPELARGIGKFMREFRRQTDEVRGVVEREFYKMDQEINSETPLVKPAEGAQAANVLPPVVPPPAVEAPKVETTPAPIDESDPGHPDHHREEKPPDPPETKS
jgi:sec-independent protein translocase protein TatB